MSPERAGLPRLVVVGASTGGIAAIRELLAGLGPAFPLPVAIVLHVPETPRSVQLAPLLSAVLPVREAEDRDPLTGVVVAPAGYHLLVADRYGYALSTAAPVNFCRPSIDVLFASAADTFGDALTGVLLTGANADGAAGLALIEAHGGRVLVQDPRTATAEAMPRAGLSTCRAPEVGSVEQIALRLARLAGAGSRSRPG